MANIKLFNNSTKAAESVPESQVDELIASGAYKFVTDKRIDVVDPTGKPYSIDASEVADAIAQRFRFDTKEMQAERKLAKEFGDRNLEAGLAGLARGATGGLSDVVATKTGIASSETLDRLKEHNPVLSPVSEGLGFVGSMFTPVGAGKAVTAAGSLAEKSLARTLASKGISSSKSLSHKMIDTASRAAAQGAVEGTFIGTGELLSENALGRAELNAENLMASAGYGALLSASGNLLFKGLEDSLTKVGQEVSKYGPRIQQQIASAEREALKEISLTPSQAARLQKQNVKAHDLKEFVLDVPRQGDEDFVSWYHRIGDETKTALGSVYQQSDDIAKQIGLTLDNVYQPQKYIDIVQRKIDDMAPYSRRAELQPLRDLRKNLEEGRFLPQKQLKDADGASNGMFDKDGTAGPFSSLKRVLDKVDEKAKWAKNAKNTDIEDVARQVRAEIRKDLNESLAKLAQDPSVAGTSIAKTLEDVPKLNRRAEIHAKLKDFVSKKEANESFENIFKMASFTNKLSDAIMTGASRLAGMDQPQLMKIRLLDKMEKAIAANRGRMESSITKFFDKSVKAGKIGRVVATKALTDLTFNPDPPKRKEKEDKYTAFNRISEELVKLTNPELQFSMLNDRFKTLHAVAPYTHSEITYKTINAADFLRSKLPANPAEGRTINPLVRKWKPSDVALAKFERYAHAVNDPLSVIDKFGEGIIDREGVEVLENVYPELYNEFKTEVIARVGQMTEQLPYSKRLELRNVLDISVDPSTEPQSVKMLQANLAPQQDTQAQQRPGTPSQIRARLELDPAAVASGTDKHLLSSELA
jgi:hypothetical protein